jgi:predicted nucleic acid-binding protein
MSLIFADAFYFVARLNRYDQHHSKVMRFSPNSGDRLLTTEWVMLEVADALAGSDIRQNIRNFVDDLRRSSASEVVPVSSGLFAQSLDLYHQHKDKEWTLTDCTSFLIMRERGITEALTGDRHFEQAGFTALLK